MEEGTCILGHKGASPIPFLQAQEGGETFVYRRCPSCGLVFLSPRPDPEEILRYYRGDYYGAGEKKFRSWIEAPRLSFAWRRVRRLGRFFPQPGRALDIGCGQGTFLSLMSAQGWRVQGTELAEEPARRAIRAGIPVSLGEIREGQFPDGTLDLVTLWQVIEHLRDPAAMMRRIHPLLRKGGIVAVSTPNIEGLQARVFGGLWFHLDPPRHLYLFSPQTLRRLMTAAGFRLVHLGHLSLEQDPYGWVQGFLNRMPLPKDTLYSFLKSPPGMKKRENYAPLFKAALPAAGIFPAALILSLVMAWRNRGGTIEAFFEKEEA
jgi:2-polyprenyl-3-methyl-5-hydroxy-6-metoxy-1,4-benzoquinol methylase